MCKTAYICILCHATITVLIQVIPRFIDKPGCARNWLVGIWICNSVLILFQEKNTFIYDWAAKDVEKCKNMLVFLGIVTWSRDERWAVLSKRLKPCWNQDAAARCNGLSVNLQLHIMTSCCFSLTKSAGKSAKKVLSGSLPVFFLFYHPWLVVWTPLKNISQLGWLATQYMGKWKMFQTTNQIR